MKKIILSLLITATVVLAFGSLIIQATSETDGTVTSAQELLKNVAPDGVISDRLADAFARNNGETQRVAIYLDNEVEIPNLREQMKNTIPATTQDPALTEPEEYPNQHAIEAKQAEIMASRNAAKEAYLNQNTAFAEKYLDGKVDYISMYSPLVIAYLNADEVNELACLGEVIQIDLYKPDVAPIE